MTDDECPDETGSRRPRGLELVPPGSDRTVGRIRSGASVDCRRSVSDLWDRRPVRDPGRRARAWARAWSLRDGADVASSAHAAKVIEWGSWGSVWPSSV